MCAARLAWLDDQLSAQPERPTLVFMHHPPFTSGLAPMDVHGFDAGPALAQVISRHSQVLRISSGHLHRPITTGWAGTVVSVAPSTAHQIALNPTPDTPIAIIMEPPAFLLHMWDEAAGLVSHTIYTQDYEVKDRVRVGGVGK
jgi:3',5'-cyclic AMP phosphodiesterase CpdA